MRIPLYSQNLHKLMIDQLLIDGFAEGDWLSVKVDGGCVTRAQGSAGPVLNRIPMQGGVITVSLNPTSPALGKMLEARQDLIYFPRLFNMTFSTGVDEIITAFGCGFGDTPEFRTGGPVMSSRTFTLECIEIKLDVSDLKPFKDGFFGGLVNL